MKIRKDHLGLYCFDRQSGLNVLLDEVQFEERDWAVGPRHLSIALTNACELSCAFCYASKQPHSLRFDDLTNWCIEADEAGVLAVGLGGGEPTLYSRVGELCRTVHSNTDLAVTMTTHGQRFTNRLRDELTESVSFIRVSMDGLHDTYERIRGVSFSGFVEKLRIIGDTARFGINVVVMEETIAELPRILDFAMEQGAQQLLLLPLSDTGGNIRLPLPAMAKLEEWLHLNMDQFPLALSVHGAREIHVPTLPITNCFHHDREHLHIDAQGFLRETAFSANAISLSGRNLIDAISTLRKALHNENLVRIRN